jgi:hypothetical protein
MRAIGHIRPLARLTHTTPYMADVPRAPGLSWWRAARDAYQHSLPDDRLFLDLLTAWVGVVASAALLLLAWESTGVLITVVGLSGTATIAAQSRWHRRPPGVPPVGRSPALPVLIRRGH